MVEQLRQAVRAAELCLDDLAEAIAVRDEFDARIAALAGEFDSAQLWELEGQGSLSGWLRANARMSPGGAAHLSKMAQRMREHPVTAEAWRDGGLSSGQVDMIERAVPRKAVALFAEHEPEVVRHL